MASGDLWAGAEVQVSTLLAFLRRKPGLELSAILMNEGELARRLRGLGLEVVVLDETRLGPLALLRGLTRTLARLAPDVVHTHRYKENILGALAAAATGVPAMVRTVHGLTERYTGFARLKMDLYGWADRTVIRGRRQRVVAVSAAMARALERTLGAPVCLIPNGVSVEAFAAGDDDGGAVFHDGAPVVVGTAARFVPVKGLDTLLVAARAVLTEAPATRFVLLGDGPLMPALRARAAALGLEGAVRFPGHHADVRPFLARMDLFVLPSLAEGLPMALLEAMAAARPVVASRVGGVPEVVRHGEEGLLVEPGAPHALAAALLALVRDPARRATLGARARARVAETFSIEATGPRYVDLYRRLGAGERAAT